MPYLPRIVETELDDCLAAAGAVVVEGPKACGKTATARQRAASEVLLDVDRNARRLASVDPDTALAGATPRLIDEWQLEPSIWNHVRRAVDDRTDPGQFILTGSAVPADDVTRHSGAGRFTRIRMRPLSLVEAGRSSGEISLAALLNGSPQGAEAVSLSIPELAELVAIGGWPGNHGQSTSATLRSNLGYLNEIRRTDISRVAERRADPIRVGRLLRSLARNTATEATLSKLAADVGASQITMKPETAAGYLDALEQLMVVEDQPAWSPHLRSRATLREAPKRHFVDPSLAVAALRATPKRLLSDLRFLGLLFESLVVRDLRIYAQANDAEVFHYREKGGLEVDAIVQAADGRWAAFEIKLGERWIDEGMKNLRRLAQRAPRAMRDAPSEPSALAVIVPNGYGYTGSSDLGVVPIGALGP
ncbi:MAG: ATP-binding protein [Holophagales bacterium]|nr:ATP-binding protein [Holophagales bacterium]MYF94037.1 ATP-binding protein [Holophagales bacterium]